MNGINNAPFNQCVECNEIITNPICSECLAKKMQTVIKQYNPRLATDIIGIKIPGETKCLFCKEEMGLCAHCFSKDIYEELREEDPEFAEVFWSRFDLGIRGYD